MHSCDFISLPNVIYDLCGVPLNEQATDIFGLSSPITVGMAGSIVRVLYVSVTVWELQHIQREHGQFTELPNDTQEDRVVRFVVLLWTGRR